MTDTAPDTIPQKEAQRLVDAIARQRDHWSNRFAQFEAQVEALIEAKDAEISDLKARLNVPDAQAA